MLMVVPGSVRRQFTAQCVVGLRHGHTSRARIAQWFLLNTTLASGKGRALQMGTAASQQMVLNSVRIPYFRTLNYVTD